MADFNFITPRLATGGQVTREDVVDVMAAGITHVIDCQLERHDSTLFYATTVRYLWNPTADDGVHPKPTLWFQKSVEFALSALAFPRIKVLAHCVLPGTSVGALEPCPIESCGDEVIGRDGLPHHVTARMHRPYDGDVVIVQARGILPLGLTLEHPVLVLRAYRNSSGRVYKPNWKATFDALRLSQESMEPMWLPAGDIQLGDFLLSPRWELVARGLPMLAPRAYSHNIPVQFPCDSDVAWLLGAYVGDGDSSENSIRLTMGVRDDVDRAVTALEKIGLEPSVRKAETYCRVIANSRTLADNFSSWCGKHSYAKRLPQFVFSSRWDWESTLVGLLAADATYNPKRSSWKFLTTSITLAWQVWYLLVSKGQYPYIRKYIRYSGYPHAHPAWEVEWREAQQHYTSHWGHYYCLPVVSVEHRKYRGIVYNLSVAESNTFLANGVITHNCGAGVNRGPSTAFAILVAQGFPPEMAEQLIRAARPQVGMAYKDDALAALKELDYL